MRTLLRTQDLDALPRGADGRGKIGFPDVPAVDEAQGEDLLPGRACEDPRKLRRSAHEVNVEAGHGKIQDHIEVLREVSEIRGQHEGDTRGAGKPFVCALHGLRAAPC